MESNTQFDKRTVIRSMIFITGFWSLMALMVFGLFKLFDAIDITAIISSVFGV